MAGSGTGSVGCLAMAGPELAVVDDARRRPRRTADGRVSHWLGLRSAVTTVAVQRPGSSSGGRNIIVLSDGEALSSGRPAPVSAGTSDAPDGRR